MTQTKMPLERPSVTRRLELGEITLYATVGLREDGTPGELFLRANSLGSTESGLFHALALVISKALQWGVPLEEIVEKLERLEFEPRGFTGDAEIRSASSIVDYLAQWLRARFLKKEAA